MTTSTAALLLQNELDDASPTNLPDALRKVKLGHLLSVIKVTVTGLSATATPDITSAAVLAAATVSGITLATGEKLPPIGQVRTLRVTASGTAASQIPHMVTDAGGTPAIPAATTAGANVGVATLSDDGKTLTFANTVTGFVIEYRPLPYTSTQTAVAY